MKKKLNIAILGLAVVFMLFSLNINTPVLAENELEFPSVKLVVDGSFLPDSDALLHSRIELPNAIRQQIAKDVYDPLFSLDNGFEVVPLNSYDVGVHKVAKIDGQWRVYFTLEVDAPLIDIWSDNINSRNPNGPSLGLSDSYSGAYAVTKSEAQSNEDMGLKYFYGSESFQFENSTDEDFETSWEYTTDFLVDNYNILLIEGFQAFTTSTNVSVVVSYVEDLSYTDLSSTYAFNVTLFDNVLPQEDEWWWRLDLENTNTSFDAYVANIEITNFKTDGRYILSTNANVTDTRYTVTYVGRLNNPTSLLNAEDRFAQRIDPKPMSEGNLRFNNYYTDSADRCFDTDIYCTDATEDFKSPFRKEDTLVTNQANGWDTADDLEESISEGIEGQTGIEEEDQDDILITKAIMDWIMSQGSFDFLDDLKDDIVNEESSIAGFLSEMIDKSFPNSLFATDVDADGIKCGINEKCALADSDLDNTNSIFTALKQDALNWGADVLGWITNDQGQIDQGAISVVSKIRDNLDFFGTYGYTLLVGALVTIAVIVIILRMRAV